MLLKTTHDLSIRFDMRCPVADERDGNHFGNSLGTAWLLPSFGPAA